MKKMFIIILSIVLIFTSCKKDNKIAGNIHNKNIEDNEVTIAIWKKDYDQSVELHTPMLEHIFRYNKSKNVRVKFDIIRSNTYREFLDKLNIKLYLDKGPTLVYIANMPYFYGMFREKGIAEKVDNNIIPNLNNVYDFYLEEEIHFVPVGADYICTSFNKVQLDKLGITYPKFDWTVDDYYNIREKWIEETSPKEFLRKDLKDIVIYKLDNMEIFKGNNEKINIDTIKMKESIKEMKKEIYSQKYILPKDFTYEDYHNSCFNYKKSEKYKSFIFDGLKGNNLTYDAYSGLNTASLKNGIIDDRVHFPNVKKTKYNVVLSGFIVNSSGKNKNLGYKFLNSLLGEEFQMQMYKGDKVDYVVPSNMYAPVIKTVEDDIEKVESEQDLEPEIIELKNYIYNKMEKGEIRPEIYRKDKTLKTITLRKRLYKDLFKFIFTEEEYSDEELSRELQKLEDRYNLYLNE